ncbi:MAG: hypothetical protein AB2L26_02950 [Ignavibacteria bacterium]
MKRNLMNIVLFMFVIAMLTAAYSCSNNDNPVNNTTAWDNNSINGRITFTDSAGYYKFRDTTAGYYDISAFATWPPTGNASANSKMTLKMENGKMVADYKLTVSANGFYTITTSYIKLPYMPGSVYGLGKYGSDTSHSPARIFDTTNARVQIQNNAGVGDINFISWLDTTNKIYKF